MARRTAPLLILLTVVALIPLGGCDYTQYKSQRTVQVNAPLAAGNAFEAATHNGHINIRGAEAQSCDVTATIEGRATTEERAKELADQTSVSLQQRGGDIVAVIDKPLTASRESIAVSFDVNVPATAALKLETHNGAVSIRSINSPVACRTHNGALDLADIADKVDAATHNGQVRASSIGAGSKLVTHNGQIVCENLGGCIFLETHNGNITASFAPDCSPACEISAVTHNGGINIAAPPELSAMVALSTHNGSVNTAVPITVSGEVTKQHIAGQAGAGEGKVRLETYNGSIKLH